VSDALAEIRRRARMARARSEGTGHYAAMCRSVVPLYERAAEALAEAERTWSEGLKNWPRAARAPGAEEGR
jgi:hypothetical protein